MLQCFYIIYFGNYCYPDLYTVCLPMGFVMSPRMIKKRTVYRSDDR